MLPALVKEREFAGGVAVVIDVLRATTTIVHALAAGAERIVPVVSVEEALRIAEAHDARPLLGGERGGEKIDGFDLGNSPLEYTAEVVSGRQIIFTTTNGTRALHHCRRAERVFAAAFSNLSAVVQRLQQEECDVHLLCAGTDGYLTAEDIVLAGATAQRLCQYVEPPASAPDAESTFHPDVQSQTAIDYYLARAATDDDLLSTMRASRGGRNLARLGKSADIERACRRDLFDIVPEWSQQGNAIRISTASM